jgi:hypothetical protein
MCLRYVLLIDQRDIRYLYIYYNVLATILRHFKHAILNILNCSMRMDGQGGVAMLSVDFRNFVNTPKSTTVCKAILFST